MRARLLAFARKLRGETLDENPQTPSTDVREHARELGYRAGWNDRTRVAAKEVEELAIAPAAVGVSLAEQTARVIAGLTPRELIVLESRFGVVDGKRPPSALADECAKQKHTVARPDGQCRCGVFFVGVKP